MVCKNCGMNATDDIKFCSSCGELLEENPEKKFVRLALLLAMMLLHFVQNVVLILRNRKLMSQQKMKKSLTAFVLDAALNS